MDPDPLGSALILERLDPDPGGQKEPTKMNKSEEIPCFFYSAGCFLFGLEDLHEDLGIHTCFEVFFTEKIESTDKFYNFWSSNDLDSDPVETSSDPQHPK